MNNIDDKYVSGIINAIEKNALYPDFDVEEFAESVMDMVSDIIESSATRWLNTGNDLKTYIRDLAEQARGDFGEQLFSACWFSYLLGHVKIKPEDAACHLEDLHSKIKGDSTLKKIMTDIYSFARKASPYDSDLVRNSSGGFSE